MGPKPNFGLETKTTPTKLKGEATINRELSM